MIVGLRYGLPSVVTRKIQHINVVMEQQNSDNTFYCKNYWSPITEHVDLIRGLCIRKREQVMEVQESGREGTQKLNIRPSSLCGASTTTASCVTQKHTHMRNSSMNNTGRTARRLAKDYSREVVVRKDPEASPRGLIAEAGYYMYRKCCFPRIDRPSPRPMGIAMNNRVVSLRCCHTTKSASSSTFPRLGIGQSRVVSIL